LQDHRLVIAEHGAGSDTENKRVADLARGAGDDNANGFFMRVLL
jgi:hypothetical protein